jgi:hypoxanthine phosphoribosyltransferase
VLRDAVTLLGQKITADYKDAVEAGDELICVGILKGSFVFLADLVRAIDLPCAVDFIALSSYGDATQSSGVVQLTQDLSRPIAGKHILIVEDIIDTGLTMRYLFENLKTRTPKSIKLAALLEKPEKNKSGVKADYLGFAIADRFVVGYGLDFKNHYRNLPFVGVLTG